MRFLMVIAADAVRAERWTTLSAAAQAEAEAPLREWFERHAAAGKIESGHELAYPRDAFTIALQSGSPVATAAEPGPPDSILSGVLVLETDSAEEAVALASTWPDLTAPADTITVVPIRSYDE